VTVFAPVKESKKQEQQGKNPYVAKPGDSPQVAAWRERMGTEEAQEKYKQRGKTEWPNAECRNRGLQQFLVRGLAKVKSVVLWVSSQTLACLGARLCVYFGHECF
jgi:hypothetical protein